MLDLANYCMYSIYSCFKITTYSIENKDFAFFQFFNEVALYLPSSMGDEKLKMA